MEHQKLVYIGSDLANETILDIIREDDYKKERDAKLLPYSPDQLTDVELGIIRSTYDEVLKANQNITQPLNSFQNETSFMREAWPCNPLWILATNVVTALIVLAVCYWT